MSNYMFINRQLTNVPDELNHYGVIGMRWGHRRANKFAKKSSLAKASAKEWEEMARYKEKQGKAETAAKYRKNAEDDRQAAAKYAGKSKAIKSKNIKRAGGKKAYDYSTKESIGKSAAKTLLLGSYGAMKYNEARSKGLTRGKAYFDAYKYATLNQASYGAYGANEDRKRKRNG